MFRISLGISATKLILIYSALKQLKQLLILTWFLLKKMLYY